MKDTILNLCSFIVGSIILVIGWSVNNSYESGRDVTNKIREVKINYLIDAYKKLSMAANRPPYDSLAHANIEQSIGDIQLFGSPGLIYELRDSIKSAKKSNGIISFNFDSTLDSLRNDLRIEMNLTKIDSNVSNLRFSNHPSTNLLVDTSKKTQK